MTSPLICLSNERLAIEIARPGTAYRGARYDWAGFIRQVTLDGRHTFCGPESPSGEGSGGVGLCNEFGIFRPIGYEEARPGQQFPKLGVGLLTKIDDGIYDFSRAYALAPFPVEVQVDAHSAQFVTLPVPCRGYAARLKKTISLSDCDLRIAYELDNVGEEWLCTHEYVHNFIAIDGHAPGPDYELRLGAGTRLHHIPPSMTADGDCIRWLTAPTRAFLAQTMLGGEGSPADPLWTLTHHGEGVGVSESVDVPVSHLALWCAPHLVSPEAFVEIDLAPGATARWTRHYRFSRDVAESETGTVARRKSILDAGRRHPVNMAQTH